MPRISTTTWPDGEKVAMFFCPGCAEHHGPVVDRPSGTSGALWAWNGDMERPTFAPSILVTGKRRLTEDEYFRIVRGEHVDVPGRVCHSFVRDGRIEFLSDSTHALAGQTVDLPEVDD